MDRVDKALEVPVIEIGQNHGEQVSTLHTSGSATFKAVRFWQSLEMLSCERNLVRSFTHGKDGTLPRT